jgi:hypothetical protein
MWSTWLQLILVDGMGAQAHLPRKHGLVVQSQFALRHSRQIGFHLQRPFQLRVYDYTFRVDHQIELLNAVQEHLQISSGLCDHINGTCDQSTTHRCMMIRGDPLHSSGKRFLLSAKLLPHLSLVVVAHVDSLALFHQRVYRRNLQAYEPPF